MPKTEINKVGYLTRKQEKIWKKVSFFQLSSRSRTNYNRVSYKKLCEYVYFHVHIQREILYSYHNILKYLGLGLGFGKILTEI